MMIIVLYPEETIIFDPKGEESVEIDLQCSEINRLDCLNKMILRGLFYFRKRDWSRVNGFDNYHSNSVKF